MHGRPDGSGGTEKARAVYLGIRLVVIPAILAVALVALAIKQPNMSRWISDAAQAEFVNTGRAQGAPATETARPAPETRVVRAN